MIAKLKFFFRRLIDLYRLLGYKNVHPSCHLGGGIQVFNKDNLIMAEQSNINAGAVIMNTRAKFIMGKYSGAAMNLFVVTGNHMSVPGMSKREVTDEVKDKFDINHEYDQDVIVDEDVWIGANVMLLSGTHVGRGAIVGAGSVVRGKVPPYSIVSGNPAKVTSFRFRLNEILYHESKLYGENERLSMDEIEKGYYDFYGKTSAIAKDSVFTLDDYREVYHNVFGIDVKDADKLEAYVTDEWDSIGQTRLVVEIEKVFGVSISSEENRKLKSFRKGFEILKEKGVQFKEEKVAYVFPGQGSQFVGMGNDWYNSNDKARDLFEKANDILGFRITDLMFEGTDEDLKRTEVTQPAVFLCSVIPALVKGVKPDMVAGHSLGEFSALVICGALSFEDGLHLVSVRAKAMQEACVKNPGTMAAVLQRDTKVSDSQIAEICESVDGIVVPVNFNCPGQVIISGEVEAVAKASDILVEKGVKKVVALKVGGAFHSPLMESARMELAEAINQIKFNYPLCPIYQNVDGKDYVDPEDIKKNLISQLTSPVRWSDSVTTMIADGASSFVECGAGNVLKDMVMKINNDVKVTSLY